MSELPFPFVADDFYPLQPEDADAELQRRTLPQYADKYTNVAELRYAEAGISRLTNVVSEYALWVAECSRMDAETERARGQWREAVAEKDYTIAQLKAECEELRMRWRKLQLRPKPPQPKSDRNRP